MSARLLRLFAKAPNAFWRHDVDLDLAAATRMAHVAQLAGISSTFYILPGGLYNPFSPENAHLLNTIRAAGHTLGLHVNADGTDPHAAIDKARRLFHAAYGDLFDLTAVSFHMPSPDLLWRDFEGLDSAYATKWKGRYVSDSRGEWTPAKEALVADHMQVALHAEWWCP